MPAPVTLFTVGHSNRSLPALVALLHEAGVAELVDVRAYPVSRRHPQFDRAALEPALAAAGIAYRWAGRELGGHRPARPDSPHTALEAAGFRGYADHMETLLFTDAAEALLAAAAAAPTAVLCAERRPEQCHRSLLADWLVLRGAAVIHLIDTGLREPHRLSSLVRREGGRLVYDRQTTVPLFGDAHV